jgi:hypothetical protein
MYLPVWLYSYQQPGGKGGMLHYIAVNGRTGETMGSVPVQQWKLLLAALTVGTILEGHRDLDTGELTMSDDSMASLLAARPGRRRRPVLGAVSALPQHRQVARLRARDRGRGEAGDRLRRKVGTNNGTQERRISGDNVREYRRRVERVRKRSG